MIADDEGSDSMYEFNVKMFACIAACLAAVGGALAQDSAEFGQKDMTEEERAMMAAWQKAATPGVQHSWLEESAGSWHVNQKMWMRPGAEPQVSEGKAEREILLGGRVLREVFTSTFMGQPYEGRAHTGYDNVTGEFWVTWMDNLSTALYTGTGECDKSHSHCEYDVSGTDPMGGTQEMRIEVDIADGREVHRFFETRDGEEFQSMKMVYTPAE